MTQLPLFEDATLPVQACVHRQVAVVFTAVGGRDKGKQVYHVHPEPEGYCAYLRNRQRLHGVEPDARVMERSIAVSEWEPL